MGWRQLTTLAALRARIGLDGIARAESTAAARPQRSGPVDFDGSAARAGGGWLASRLSVLPSSVRRERRKGRADPDSQELAAETGPPRTRSRRSWRRECTS
jgi:hypothetical protein